MLEIDLTPEMIDAFDEWHARRPRERINTPIVPYLRQRFSLSNKEAIAVLREANLRKRRAE